MSDFWNTSTGESAVTEAAAGSFDAGSGDFDVIPKDTKVVAMPETAKWIKAFESTEDLIQITWVILKPEAYQNRKLFHKLWVKDFDPNVKDADKAKAKRDKHLKMLAAIDANAGGKMAKLNRAPTDDDLSIALLNKPMVLGLGVWNDETKKPKGNWVMSVAPKGPVPEVEKAASGGKKTLAEDLDEDLPF